ncbi:hypothetical protein D3C85_1865340 [compost metagenome]
MGHRFIDSDRVEPRGDLLDSSLLVDTSIGHDEPECRELAGIVRHQALRDAADFQQVADVNRPCATG